MSRPLRVLLIDHAPIIGGVEIMIRDLLSALDPAVIAATVVTDEHSPMRGRFGPLTPEITLPLTRLKRNSLAGWSLLLAALRLARLARRAQADVLQTFTARTHLMGALAGQLARLPVVWRINDDTLPRGLMATTSRLPRTTICVSEHLRRFYGQALRAATIIPDGVPLVPLTPSREARRALGLPESALIITLVARLVRWKGHAVFLRALAELSTEYPLIHGLVVGGYTSADNQPGPLAGGAAYEAELLALVDSLHLSGRVTFLGHRDQTAPIYSASDIVTHTSVLPEPFGRVIVEAMAAGRPVVATAAGGPQEIVQAGVTGWLTPPGDSRALADALRPLCVSADLRRQMGLAGRQRAEEEYSLHVMAERFVAAWTAAAHGRRASGGRRSDPGKAAGADAHRS